MRKVATYLLERRERMNWQEARNEQESLIKADVLTWLRSKGAPNTESPGVYQAEDGSRATFTIEEAVDAHRAWWLLRLVEVTEKGRIFDAAVSVSKLDDTVTVYGTIKVGWEEKLIKPIPSDARCPRIIRSLLKAEGPWFHGTTRLRRLRRFTRFENGEGLAEEIADPTRTVPIVVVSMDDGGVALPRLDDRIAFDLAGLANVATVNAAAAWALTDRLGTKLACYRGGVRLYWPNLALSDDPFRHPLWTGRRLRDAGEDPKKTRERLRKHLRRTVMRASALSVSRPVEIARIRGASARHAFATMKAKARSAEDYEELADSYAADNDRLQQMTLDLQEQIDERNDRIVELEEQRDALLARVESAEVQLRYREETSSELSPDNSADEEEGPGEPVAGEIRIYKKVHAAPGHDVMVHIGDCGHNSWQRAKKADKARKGISKLENGRRDWRKMQHCGSCTGGGMWCVEW